MGNMQKSKLLLHYANICDHYANICDHCMPRIHHYITINKVSAPHATVNELQHHALTSYLFLRYLIKFSAWHTSVLDTILRGAWQTPRLLRSLSGSLWVLLFFYCNDTWLSRGSVLPFFGSTEKSESHASVIGKFQAIIWWVWSLCLLIRRLYLAVAEVASRYYGGL